jgi:phage terminase small subunit
MAKSGTSKAAAATRRRLFVEAYLTNGHNATQAAISAGYSAKTAGSQGQRLLKDVDISGALAAQAEKVARVVGLETERTLQEVAWIAHGDPGEIYDENNQLLPIKQMPLYVRATIAGIDHDKDTGRVIRIRFWDKNAALEKAMKHHGLYDRDNRQKSENLMIQVNLVGPPAEDGPRVIGGRGRTDGRGNGRRW